MRDITTLDDLPPERAAIYQEIAKTEVHDGDTPGVFYYARTVFDWSADPSAIAEACAWRSGAPALDGTRKAVYVISADDRPYSKIGITDDPVSRLDGLQTSNWDKLHLRYVLWVWGPSARQVEKMSHRRAFEQGVECRREWVLLEPNAAMALVIDCAKELQVEATDALGLEITQHDMVMGRTQSMRAHTRAEQQQKYARLGY